METLFASLSLAAGGLLAVQAGANTQLSKAAGGPFTATMIQVVFAGGLLLLAAAAVGSLAAFANFADVPWWRAVGGLATAFYVASTILLFSRLGAIVTVGLYIAGQMTASVALDTFGLLGVAQKPLDAIGTIGLLAVLSGAVAVVFGQAGAVALSWTRLGWSALALAAGAVLPAQGAVNGLLRTDLGAPFVVGAINFAVAALAMAVVLLVAAWPSRPTAPRLRDLTGMPWWGWLGGFGGAAYVTTMFTAIPVIGAATTVGLTIAGQQIASVFVDRYGWFRLPRRPISAVRLAGVLALLLGVGLVQAV